MMMGSRAVQDTLLNLTKVPLHIESGVYKEAGTNIASKSYSFIDIGKGDAGKLSTAVFAAVKARMQTGNGTQPVSFRSTDHIRIKAYGTFAVSVDFSTMTK